MWLLTWDLGPHFWNSGTFPNITMTLACDYQVWSEYDGPKLIMFIAAVYLPHRIMSILSYYYELFLDTFWEHLVVMCTFVCVAGLVLRQIFKSEIQNGSQIAVIATSRSVGSLHKTLTYSRGQHFFSTVIELKPPNHVRLMSLTSSSFVKLCLKFCSRGGSARPTQPFILPGQ